MMIATERWSLGDQVAQSVNCWTLEGYRWTLEGCKFKFGIARSMWDCLHSMFTVFRKRYKTEVQSQSPDGSGLLSYREIAIKQRKRRKQKEKYIGI